MGPVFDVVFYNAAYVPTAALCWLAAGRVRAERTAWRALTFALLLSTADLPAGAARDGSPEGVTTRRTGRVRSRVEKARKPADDSLCALGPRWLVAA